MKIFNLKTSFPILLSMATLTVIFSCSRDDDAFEGPNLIDRFGPFEVIENLTVTRDSVNFSAGENVVFEAQFNKNINWVVEITGKESGAVKRIEGFSNVLDASNAVWTGGTTELPFFRTEGCEITLTVPEEPDFLNVDSVRVNGLKTYPGSVFMDFEGDTAVDRIEIGNFEFDFDIDSTGIRSFIPAAEGEQYLSLLGTDNTLPAGFFVGLVVLNPGGGQTYIDLPTTAPENLFFNCFIHSDGRPYTIAVIQFFTDANDNGTFEDSRDASYVVEGDFPLDWIGWRQISHSMAETGISEAELEKLIAIRLLLISDNNANTGDPKEPVYYGIDYLTFTQGQPLQL